MRLTPALPAAHAGDAPIVITERRDGPPDTPRAPGPALTDAPLLVLVNSHTASASEIVAGALHDNCRAVLAGGRTYGKGLIQSVYELSDGSGLVITVGKYLTPSGTDIDRCGGCGGCRRCKGQAAPRFCRIGLHGPRAAPASGRCCSLCTDDIARAKRPVPCVAGVRSSHVHFVALVLNCFHRCRTRRYGIKPDFSSVPSPAQATQTLSACRLQQQQLPAPPVVAEAGLGAGFWGSGGGGTSVAAVGR